MRRHRQYLLFVCSLIGVRLIQMVRVNNGYAPPILQLSLTSITTTGVAGFLIAPLFIYLLLMRIRVVYHPSVLVRCVQASVAYSSYLRRCAFDALFAACTIQASGLCAAVALRVSFDSSQLLVYLVPTTCLLWCHFMLAGCLLLLGSVLFRGMVLSLLVPALYLCWDLCAQYVTYLVQADAYTGWLLIEGLLSTHAHWYALSALRVLAVAFLVVGALFWLSEHASVEKIVARFGLIGG